MRICWQVPPKFQKTMRRTVKSSGGLEARVIKLETELAELKEAFDKLMKELM